MRYPSWIVLIIVGYFMANIVLDAYTIETLPSLVRLIAIAGIPVCAPIWKLFDNLRKLRDHDELNKQELREVAYRITNNVRLMFFNMIYLLVGSVVIFIVLYTLQDAKYLDWALRALFIYIFTALGILVNTIYNIKEIETFENMLAFRKNKVNNSKKLLKQMKGKDSD